MNNELMFSSKTDLWETPQWFFDKLDKVFNFGVDVCALPDNAKCANYYTPDDNGLTKEWRGTCWMNPPYGDPEHICKPKCKKKKCITRGYCNTSYKPGIVDFVCKAYKSAKENGATVVCLLPARVDTRWWHDYCTKGEVFFVKGRLKFGGCDNSAPFPNAVVVFRPNVHDALGNCDV